MELETLSKKKTYEADARVMFNNTSVFRRRNRRILNIILYYEQFCGFWAKAESSDPPSQRVFQPPRSRREVQKFLPRNRLDGLYASFLRTLLERNIPWRRDARRRDLVLYLSGY